MSWFEDAGLNVSDIADDPYGFGNDHHLIGVDSVKSVKVSEKGFFGMYVYFKLLDEKFESLRPFGMYIQLPPPKEVQKEFGYVFDPKNDLKHAKVLSNLVKFLTALGFGVDEIQSGAANEHTIVGRYFLAKMRSKEGDSGFDEFRWFQPMKVEANLDPDAPGGLDHFAKSTEDKVKEALQREADES